MEEDLETATENLSMVTIKTKELIQKSGGKRNFIIIVVLILVVVVLLFLILYTWVDLFSCRKQEDQAELKKFVVDYMMSTQTVTIHNTQFEITRLQTSQCTEQQDLVTRAFAIQ